MHFIAIPCLLALASFASADVASFATGLANKAGNRVNNLFNSAKNLHRDKRQALIISFNETEDSSKEACVLKCLYKMDEKLEKLWPSNETDTREKSQKIVEDFKPEDFEQFCDAYRPGSECLKSCGDSELRNFSQNGLKVVEVLCVDKYQDFKKNLPCMNKIGKEVEKTCEKQCEKYEHALDKLEKLGDPTEEPEKDIDTDEIRFLFSEGCKYVTCAEDCGNPLTEKACGKEAADLESLLVRNAFQSVNDMLNSFGPVDAGFWPKECISLGSRTSS